MYKIYKVIYIKCNKIIYIGCTRQSLRSRFSEHVRASGSAIHSIIEKYGKENFEIIKIDESDKEAEAFLKEEFWTNFFRKRTYLFNKMAGRRLTQRQRDILYQSRIGTHHTEETKEKIRRHFLGKPGHKPSYQTRMKLSQIRKGDKNPFWGKHHTDGFKKMISKPVLCVTTGEIFPSMKDAGSRYGIPYSSNIGKCCMGKLSQYGKLKDGTPLIWQYA